MYPVILIRITLTRMVCRRPREKVTLALKTYRNRRMYVCLFVLGFNVSLTLFHSYCDGTCMRQVRVLPHWKAPVAGTWQDHPIQSHYKLTPGRPAIFPSSHLSMPSVRKEAACTIFLRRLVCRGWGLKPQPSVPLANALQLHHLGRLMNK